MDWAHVTPWAAFMVEGQALAIPELSRLPRLPNSNILAPGFGFRQKRHAKTQPRKSPADVAKAFHERRMRQFVRSERTGSVQTVGLSPMVHEKLALALAKSLEFANGVRQLLPDGTKAWSLPYIYQHRGLPPVAVPNCRAPVSPTIKLTIHGENAAISSVKNAGAPAAPASRINLGVSADCNKNSGMSSLTTAGAAAPVSPAMKLAGCTENTSITSVTNAGFSVAPVCGSMIWTRCAEKSGISSVTTAGTKQSQDVGCHAESARRGPIPRKRLMMEQTCADQDFVPKKQRSGEFTVVRC